MAGPRTGSAAGFAIPPSDRKLVQSLKEIVANSEEEIYVMLKECNMDPNETAQRLLSEDMFHVVKRKRDKRKEIVNSKEIPENKSRAANLIASSKGGKCVGMPDCSVGRAVTSSYLDSNDLSGGYGKPLPAGENGAYSSSKGWNTASTNASHTQTIDQLKGSSTSTSSCASSLPNGGSLESRSASVSQVAWVGGSGHATLADIVRSNGTHVVRSPVISLLPGAVVSSTVQSSSTSQHSTTAISSIPSVYSSVSDSVLNPSLDPCASGLVSPMKRDVGTVGNQRPIGDRVSNVPSEANLIQSTQPHHSHLHQVSSASAVFFNDLDPDLKIMQSSGPASSIENLDDQPENAENSGAVVGTQDHSGVVHPTSLPVLSSSSTVLVGSHFNPVVPYQTQQSSICVQEVSGCSFDWNSKPAIQNGSDIAAVAVQGTSTAITDFVPHSLPSPPADTRILSGTTVKLQELNLQDSLPVIIPEHLRVSVSDCTQLSFGSFGADFRTLVPASFTSEENKKSSIIEENDLLEKATVAEEPSSSDLGTSTNFLNHHEQTLPATVESLVSSSDGSDASVSSPVSTILHVEPIKLEAAHQCAQYSYLPTAPGYHGFNLVSQMNNPSEQTESRSYDLSHLPSVMQPCLDPTASYPTASYYNAAFRSPPEGDNRYSSSSVSSTSGRVRSNIPAAGQVISSAFESGNTALLSASGSLGMPAQCGNNQTAPTASQQSLPIHAYTAQPSGLPLGPFTNVFSYQYVPPNFAYLPSPYQHSYTGNSGYHQAPKGSSYPLGGGAAFKYPMSQYKPGGGGGAGLHSAALAGTAGYGGYINSQTGTYAVNPTVTIGSSTGYDDAAAQYKDNGLYIQNQQVEGSAMWLQTQLSQEMPAAQPASYYTLPGQNQHSVYSHPQQSHTHTHPAAAYAGMYHPQQSVPSASAHQLFQQTQVLGNIGAAGVHAGSYQQPQRAQQAWTNNF